MNLSFHGAAAMVTGSCYLLELSDMNLLIDCGMFQGGGDEYQMNGGKFDFDVSSIDYVILTHAHIDHCGRLPLLSKRGFHGKIIATEPTIQLAELMLIDSAKIQEYDFRKGRIPAPLYETSDAKDVLNLFQSLDYHVPRELSESVTVELYNAGHILGASTVKLTVDGKIIVFSGDLGHPEQKIIKDPEMLDLADYVVVESTYGNRTHLPREESVQLLHKEVANGNSRQGNVIIPTFAVERTQELLFDLNKFYEQGEFGEFPVYFDTPLGLSTTKLYSGFERYYDKEALELIAGGDDPYEFPNLVTLEKGHGRSRYSKTPKRKGIIIAGSGMCTGGKVIGYLKKNISDPNASVVFVGYQAEGTLGRQIQENKGSVVIEGRAYPVKAQIVSISGFSAHGDRDYLFRWVENFDKGRLKRVFVTHGEEESAHTFSGTLREKLGIDAYVPKLKEKVNL